MSSSTIPRSITNVRNKGSLSFYLDYYESSERSFNPNGSLCVFIHLACPCKKSCLSKFDSLLYIEYLILLKVSIWLTPTSLSNPGYLPYKPVLYFHEDLIRLQWNIRNLIISSSYFLRNFKLQMFCTSYCLRRDSALHNLDSEYLDMRFRYSSSQCFLQHVTQACCIKLATHGILDGGLWSSLCWLSLWWFHSSSPPIIFKCMVCLLTQIWLYKICFTPTWFCRLEFCTF